MSTTRLLLRRNSSPSDLCLQSSSLPSSSPNRYLSRTRIMQCSLRLGTDGQNQKSSFKDKERKSTVEMKAKCMPSSEIVISKEAQVKRGLMDLVILVTKVTDIVLTELRQAIKRQPSKLQIQRYIERVIVDCRFFTLFAVAGTLLGSVLCFFEGCCRILECYAHHLNQLSHGAKGDTLHILLEALDMFLFGTSMLILGMAIHNMFVGCKTDQSNQPSRGIRTIGEAKTRIGSAVVMILHVGMVEKFKTTPLVTCMDLACFAASLLVCSASMFIFSKLSSL